MRTLNKDKIIKIEEYINVFSQRNGCAPFLEDISSGTGIPLTTVHRYIKYMENIGMLEHDRRRGIRTKEMKDEGEMISVPVLGKVSCGEPKFAEENIEEYVKLPVTLFGSGDYFLLRANGDSMIDAGIDNGDLVLVRQQNYADAGQIVVALGEDEATLKRWYPEPENRRIRLHPENSEMEDIYMESCVIQGVAVKVIKDLN